MHLRKSQIKKKLKNKLADKNLQENQQFQKQPIITKRLRKILIEELKDDLEEESIELKELEHDHVLEKNIATSFKEEFSSAPNTPHIISEKLSEKGMILSTNIEVVIEPLSKPEVPKWRPKTRATNKLRLNMKRVLNPKLKNEKIMTIEDSSTEGELEDNPEEINQNET